MYFTLDQIYRKGYVSRLTGEPTPIRGGARKKYYHITDEGRQALIKAYKIHTAIWDGVPLKILT